MDRFRLMPNYRYYSAEGASPLSITDSIGKPLRNYKISGNSVQDETSTPTPENPVEVQSVGDKTKNLFDIDAFLALNDNSAYYSKNENGELVQVKTDYRTDTSLFNYVTLPAGNYMFSYSNTEVTKYQTYVNGESKSKTKNFTLTETSTIGFKFYENAGTVLGCIQIEEGEAITDYEPYGYKIPISIKGKNLFDNQRAIEYADEVTTYAYSYFKFENGKTYTMSCISKIADVTGTKWFRAGNLSTSRIMLNTLGYNSVTFTVPNDGVDYYLRLYDNGTPSKLQYLKFFDGTYMENRQIEENSAATDYEQYISENYNIYLDEPLRRIGDYSDYIDFINGKVIRNTTQRKVSDMQWSGKGTAYTTGLCRVQDNSNRLNNCNYNVAPLSNALTGHAGGIVVQANHITASSVYSNLYLYLSSSDVGIETPTETTSNAENYTAIMQYLIEKNVYICYALQEPTEETITLPKIKTGKGTNIIIVDTEVKPSNIEVQYYK